MIKEFLALGLAGAPIAAPSPQEAGREVHTLELVAESGSHRAQVEYRAEAEGSLHLWATSAACNPALRIERQDGTVLAEDADSGGPTTPYLKINIERGDEWRIIILGDAPGNITLSLVFSPETDVTRAAAADARAMLRDVRALQGEGDMETARGLAREVVQALIETTGAEGSDIVSDTLWSAGRVSNELFDTSAARQAWNFVMRQRERTLPRGHPLLWQAWHGVATLAVFTGEADLALALLTDVHRAQSSTLPDDHGGLQATRHDLAVLLHLAGDLAGARAMQEAVLDVFQKTLPVEHLSRQKARANLAVTLRELGDLKGAKEMQESVLEILQRTLPPDHDEVQGARQNLAITLWRMRRYEDARILEEKVLEVRERMLPPDHRSLQGARQNLANTLRSLGEFDRALELQEQALEVFERSLPADHRTVLRIRHNVASTLLALGELESGETMLEENLRVQERVFPPDHPDLALGRDVLSWAHAATGDAQGARAAAAAALESLELRLRTAAFSSSPRELEGHAQDTRRTLAHVLSLALGAGVFPVSEELTTRSFELVESVRGIELFAARLAHAASTSELTEELEDVRDASAKVVRLATQQKAGDLIEAVQDRDRAQRRLVQALTAGDESSTLWSAPSLAEIRSSLAPHEAVVGYWRFGRATVDEARPGHTHMVEELVAFVVRPNRPLATVELGHVEPIRGAIAEWRDAILAPIERGVAVGDAKIRASAHARAKGETLRGMLLDPLIDELGDAHRLIVALDDELHLVPLDALPLGDGWVGDRFSIAVRPTLWSPPDTHPERQHALLVMGGIDYDLAAEHSDPGSVGAHRSLLRSGAWDRAFAPLLETGTEVRTIAHLFRKSFGDEASATVLQEQHASRTALFELAPGARWLHLATHGYFAPESIPSSADPTPVDAELGLQSWTRQERVTGLSPMVLCGLALAGANLPPDEIGRVEGVITAEEVATLDLRACELAVLSACDTNVGARANQGVASLQKALHMAGARSVVTSLWRVRDEPTRELMTDFYRRLWVQKKPKAQALWEAKVRLRDKRNARGEPVYHLRDWAGWVLTGDPE